MLFHVLQVGLDTAAVEVAENIAKAAEPALQAAPQQVEQSYSLIQMAAKGGWLMIVLAILSVIAIYIFGKKWWMIHRAKQVDKNFMRDIRDYIHEGKVKTRATIAGGAPMIGFLGTVLGMVQAFFNMANAGNNIDITLLSSGIYTAMITTVGGLIVGILAYFGYNYLTAQISNLMFKMETATIDFMDLLHEPADNEEEK